MNLYSCLSEEDLEKISCWARRIGGPEGDSLDTVRSDKFLESWSEDKNVLYKLLGEKFILEQAINIRKSQDMLENLVWEEIIRGPSNFIRLMSGFTDAVRWGDTYHSLFEIYPELKAYVKEIRNEFFEGSSVCDIGRCLNKLISMDSLIKNVYQEDSFTLPAYNGRKKLKINKGCKVVKTLGKIAAHLGLDMDDFEKFRLAHSQCLNQKYLSGTLCLSIHPLDYMTMSDNDYGWSSCMSWMDCGDYRQGTLEMMGSQCVLVAYLKGNDDYNITYDDELTWNNKKWRQLFVIHPDLLLGIKSYPYESESLTTTTLGILRDLAIKNLGWDFPDTMSKIDNRHSNVIATAKNSPIYINLSMNHMYNDIGSNHFAYVGNNIADHFDLFLSGTANCLICGQPLTTQHESMLICEDCDDSKYCENCGCRIDESDGTWFNGEFLCYDCFETETAICPHCNDCVWSGEMIGYVYLKNGDIGSTGYSIELCESCYENDFKDKTSVYKVPSGYSRLWPQTYTFLDINDLMEMVDEETFSGMCGFYPDDKETIERIFNPERSNTIKLYPNWKENL